MKVYQWKVFLVRCIGGQGSGCQFFWGKWYLKIFSNNHQNFIAGAILSDPIICRNIQNYLESNLLYHVHLVISGDPCLTSPCDEEGTPCSNLNLTVQCKAPLTCDRDSNKCLHEESFRPYNNCNYQGCKCH